jgi:predicted amidohydrolase YtcJ
MPAGPRADLVLLGGKVLTVDPRSRVADAVAIAGDRIIAVGTEAEIRQLIAPSTRLIDVGGRSVVPGLVDGHAHMDREGLKGILPSLAGARSIDDVLQRIEVLVRATEPGEWIVTMPIGDPPSYWDVPANLRERRFPTRWELDRVSPKNPVYIRSIWGYWRHTLPLVSIANSLALQLAGITRESMPPWGGIQIDKDFATGEPTGIFLEWTLMPVVELSLMAVVPRFTHEQRVQGLRDSMQRYNAVGTTSVFEGHGVAAEVLRAYKALAERGELTVRAHLVLSPSWHDVGILDFEALLGSWATWLAGRGLGDGFLRVAGLAAQADVSPDGAVRARAMPYTGWAGFSFDAGLPRERVRDLLIAAARHDIRIVSLSTDLLDLYEEVDRLVPIRDRRWVIGHISTLTDDEIKRIRDLGLVLTTHTGRFLFKEGEAIRRRVGRAGESSIVPLRRLVESGIHVALATDNVPVSLWYPVWHAVARVDRTTRAIIGPSEKLSREAALRAATIEGAYLTFEERHKGSIEVGKLADLVVLSDDPLTLDESRLPDITAVMTIVGGRVVVDARFS